MGDHAMEPMAPAVVESFVKQLYITAKAVRLYPAASSVPRERAAALRTVLTAAQRRLAEIRFRFTSSGIYWEDAVVFPGKQAYVDLGLEFYTRNVDRVRFHVGVTERELTDFLSVLLITPAELAQAGGFEARVWDLGVSDVTVTEITAVLGAAGDPDASSELAGAVRYPDPRVRREAIRALGRIKDERASQLLVGALDDGDSANVQLAIRALSSKRYLPALPALHAIALGEGASNRNVGPRADAIEALGHLGSPESLPVLESLRRFRGLRALRRNRELAPVVDRAIASVCAARIYPAEGTERRVDPATGALDGPTVAAPVDVSGAGADIEEYL